MIFSLHRAWPARATLVGGFEVAGVKSVQWSAAGMPSGVYLYRLVGEGFLMTRKLLLAK
jgi:hypothetical protein